MGQSSISLLKSWFNRHPSAHLGGLRRLILIKRLDTTWCRGLDIFVGKVEEHVGTVSPRSTYDSAWNPPPRLVNGHHDLDAKGKKPLEKKKIQQKWMVFLREHPRNGWWHNLSLFQETTKWWMMVHDDSKWWLMDGLDWFKGNLKAKQPHISCEHLWLTQPIEHEEKPFRFRFNRHVSSLFHG